ncbi:Na(+)-translocating NADH-quinone reductase subunit C [Thalassoglobus polymorphus]|uniref:Na(+)-translocating NADH-quinone reductase subunit C n=1 Tax=Thalassoglobus polymorphus TaxID=2527994 RepID=A0A517QNP2_9PLAN|nr:Na(+)-translocating NADH-quinone reductase subunit C [Thalassoglobus polymorphus]QDT33197.1 Na(+)-translocating NADH-quinone reductase subunit C [Thalassoglobus polymorphus]
MDSETDQNQDAAETNQEAESNFEPNSFLGTLVVAVVLCLVCSFVVSTAAVALRPLQEQNKKIKQQRNVLSAAGLWDDQSTTSNLAEKFENVKIIAVNLPGRDDDAPAAGTINKSVDVKSYNQLKASKDPQQSIIIGDKDVAGIKRREKVSLVYLINDSDGNLQTIVLPIYGKGLWSTLYGYLALEADTRTVKGITFYQHGETPGLGGEVDNPKWKALWPEKTVLDESGEPIIEVTKPGVASDENQVDGLSGATITSVGVEKTIKYWLGDDAFGPFLERIRNDEIDTNE